MPILSKVKGNHFELQIVRLFKALGWKSASSTRNGSRALDAMGVDVMKVSPFHVQAKAVEKSLNYHEILEHMPVDNNINLVFHKRNRRGVIVSMTEADFFRVLNMLIESDKIKPW